MSATLLGLLGLLRVRSYLPPAAVIFEYEYEYYRYYCLYRYHFLKLATRMMCAQHTKTHTKDIVGRYYYLLYIAS